MFGTMYSCESARTKAYSNDLRWRMVYQRCMLGLTYKEIASRLSVDPSTVWLLFSALKSMALLTLVILTDATALGPGVVPGVTDSGTDSTTDRLASIGG